MSRKLISLSPDLAKLRAEGYDIEIRASYLLVKDVPYVTASKEVRRGILISSLNLAGDKTGKPDNHTVLFAGTFPCHADGSQMTELVNQVADTKLDDALTAHFSFSHKPQIGHYADYFEKMSTYAAILTSQARVLQPEVTPLTFQVMEPEEEDSPFNYLDTASSRAEINIVTKKLALNRVAIIGIGGSGSYILDGVTKTPVKQIHIFDRDKLSTHNAFRAPGAPSIEELREQPLNVKSHPTATPVSLPITTPLG